MTNLGWGSWIPGQTSGTWQYDDWFLPMSIDSDDWHPVIGMAEQYVLASAIDAHPFFTYAAENPHALAAWVTQELVVTGPFAQYMLLVGALIENVHVRARIMKVALGEHLGFRGGVAVKSHPWLLHLLRNSMELPPSAVQPFEETERFLAVLYANCRRDVISGVAAIGIGNERLLVPEYTAVRTAFAAAWPDVEYRTFLDANINEDREHADLMSQIAAVLIAQGSDPDRFLEAAKQAVDTRLEFYDSLLLRVQQRPFVW